MSRSATIALIGSPIGLLLISVIRLLIVADYNPATASAIVSSGGYVDTLLGTIIPLVPIFTPYLGLLLLFFNRVIPGLLTLLAAAFMSPMVVLRPMAFHLAGADWQSVIHRSPLVLAVLLALELLGLGLGVAARTAPSRRMGRPGRSSTTSPTRSRFTWRSTGCSTHRNRAIPVTTASVATARAMTVPAWTSTTCEPGRAGGAALAG